METETKNKLYEGMFLIDSSLAGSDWDGINVAIRKILEKAEAEIVSIEKWDDRRLAYEIDGKVRFVTAQYISLHMPQKRNFFAMGPKDYSVIIDGKWERRTYKGES